MLVNVAGGFRWETVAEGHIETWFAAARAQLRRYSTRGARANRDAALGLCRPPALAVAAAPTLMI